MEAVTPSVSPGNSLRPLPPPRVHSLQGGEKQAGMGGRVPRIDDAGFIRLHQGGRQRPAGGGIGGETADLRCQRGEAISMPNAP